MKAADRKAMYEAIEGHGNTLLAMFPKAKQKDPVKLCKSLRILERKAHRMAEDLCNGRHAVGDPEEHIWEGWAEEEEVRLKRRTEDLLGKERLEECGFFINTDPRGYALKLQTFPPTLYRDMGGYGILAPDFTSQED